MSIKSEYDEAKTKLAELETNYQMVKSDLDQKVTKLEAELTALPAELVGKADNEVAALYHKIVAYFGGVDKVPHDPNPATDPAQGN